jgi:hypothetical protein
MMTRKTLIEGVRKRPGIATSLLVAFVVLIAYENIVFRGQTLIASANYHPFDNRFDRLEPRPVADYAFVNWYDLGGAWWQFEPAGRFFALAYRRMIVPLWDPTVSAGADAHVNVTQGQYFPPRVLMLLLGDSASGRDAFYILLVLLSGVASALLMVRNGCHTFAAATTGVVYALSGAMTQTVNSVLGQSFAVIPLVVLACDELLRSPTWRKVAAFSAVVGFFVTSSFLPAVISGFFLLPFLLGAHLAAPELPPSEQTAPDLKRRRIRLTSVFVLGVVVGLGLVAVLLLPLHLTSRAIPEFQSWYERSGLSHHFWPSAVTLASPSLIFDSGQLRDPSQHLFPDPPVDFFYVGIVPLLLALFVSRGETARERRLFWFFVSAGAVLFLKLVGFPLVQWIGLLPILRHIHFVPYFDAALSLTIAGLAGLTVEQIRRKPPGYSRYEVAVAVGLVAIVVVGIMLLGRPVNLQGEWRANAIELGRVGLIVFLVRRILRGRMAGMVTGQAAAALLLTIAAFDQVTLAHRARFGRVDVWSNPPGFVKYLQRDRGLFRIHSIGDLALTPNVAQPLGLSFLSSRHSFNQPRYVELVRRYFKVARLPYPLIQSLVPDSRHVLDLLNVKYLVANSGQEIATLESKGFSRVHIDGSFHVFANGSVWPRAYLASRWELARTPVAALEAVGRLTSRDKVVVERPPSLPPQDSSGPAAGRIIVSRYSYNGSTMVVQTDRPALLVVSDSYAPGWSASVNGERADILIANYAFRAVHVPQGRSTVVFRYWPPGFIAGGVVSALSLMAIGLMCVTWRKREHSEH